MLSTLSLYRTPRVWAIIEAIIATLIWSSSFVLVKIAMQTVGPLTITGLRYLLGGLLIIALMPLRGRRLDPLAQLPRRLWLHLAAMGLTVYALGNGAFNLSLVFMDATTVAFLAAFTPLLVLFAAVIWLKEIPTWGQGVGLAATLGGSALFFGAGSGSLPLMGGFLALVGLASYTHFSIVGRTIARDRQTDTMTLTGVPLVLGGLPLLLFALLTEGWPNPGLTGWTIIFFLAAVNSALAYMMYNHAMQQLTALEINVIFNLSPLGTAVVAWFLLGEWLQSSQIVGMVVVIIGVSVVQWRRRGVPLD
jgi:drug/metabolite transporter (DMT)-like permease